MLRFCGFDLELTVDCVLHRCLEEPAVCSATDPDGRRWLIVQSGTGGHERSWVCAPASERVVELVATGRAHPADALRHSRTGWVEVVRTVAGHAVPEERVACSALRAEPPVMAGVPG